MAKNQHLGRSGQYVVITPHGALGMPKKGNEIMDDLKKRPYGRLGRAVRIGRRISEKFPLLLK